MKNGLLIWNVLLTIVAGYLLFTQLKTKKPGNGVTYTKAGGGDSSAQAPFRIAYFEMDSIENNFEMVKDVKAEISKKDEEYSNSLTKLDWRMRNKVQEYQQKGQTMTQADYENAQTELKKLEENLKSEKQVLDNNYQDFVLRRNLTVKKAIEDYLVKYNESRNYSYIVTYEQGLFYYKDTVYNITSDLIKGLNQEYKQKK